MGSSTDALLLLISRLPLGIPIKTAIIFSSHNPQRAFFFSLSPCSLGHKGAFAEEGDTDKPNLQSILIINFQVHFLLLISCNHNNPYTFFIVFKISLEYFWIFCGIITVSFKLLFSLNSIFIFLYINSNQIFYFLHLRIKSNAI